MEPEIWHTDWYRADGINGIQYAPAEFVDGDRKRNPDLSLEEAVTLYMEIGGSVRNVERISGYGARMTMPGYLDSTEWSVFDTEKEAWDYLKEYHMTDEWGEPLEEYAEYFEDEEEESE